MIALATNQKHTSAHNFANFDFHHDVDTVDDQLAAVLNADSTDLSEFREHGGKLIMLHGWANPLGCSGCFPAGAFAGWDLHPLESAALSRSTPKAATRSRPL